jgi:Domain of unknown function (DUF6933)
MIQLHVTKKLLAKLPIDEAVKLPESYSENPLSGWHGNLITLQRRNCIVMVHDATRFPLFLLCLTKPDFENLDYWFADALMNTLLKVGANDQQMTTATKLLAKLSIDSVCDRSVQGTMNRIKGDVEHMIWYDDAKIVDLSGPKIGAWLADSPCSIKGQKDFIIPNKAMLELLDNAF